MTVLLLQFLKKYWPAIVIALLVIAALSFVGWQQYKIKDLSGALETAQRDTKDALKAKEAVEGELVNQKFINEADRKATEALKKQVDDSNALISDAEKMLGVRLTELSAIYKTKESDPAGFKKKKTDLFNKALKGK